MSASSGRLGRCRHIDVVLSQTGSLHTAVLGVFRFGFSFLRVGWTHNFLGRVLEPLRRQSLIIGQESSLGVQMSAKAMNTPLLVVPHDAVAECQRSRSRYELCGNTYDPLRGGESCPMGECASALRRTHLLNDEHLRPLGINDSPCIKVSQHHTCEALGRSPREGAVGGV